MNGEEKRECCEHEYESGCACCIGECENCWTTDPMEMTDAQADADTLASAGWGTDEDYGYYGDQPYKQKGGKNENLYGSSEVRDYDLYDDRR